MRLYYLRFFLLLLFTLRLSAQQPGYKEYFMEGSYLLLENEPEQALKNFEIAYRLDSSSANINYMMGVCLIQSASKKSKAEYYLSKAVKNISNKYKSDNYKEKAAAPLALFYYGKALHFNYKFDEALEKFQAFNKYVNVKDLEYVKMVDREVRASVLAKEMVRNPVDVEIINLGDSINTEYPEYGPVISADERTILYTTRRPGNTGGLKDSDGSNFEDIVVSYKDNSNVWSKPVPLGINTIGHEAAINVTADGQTLLVFKNEAGGPVPGGNGNIYYAEYDGKDWQELKEFGADVNSLYLESHACLNNEGNMLFFSSERPGGYGGKDLYRCIKLPTGQWSKALNMGPEINSEYDEDGGFFHPDGVTFYFASNGLQSMGGFDVLHATLNDEGKFVNITNMGYPINTTDDDIFYVSSPDARRGYFSSAAKGGKGDKDIYMIRHAEERDVYLALFKGQILPAEGETLPENITIIATDKETNLVVGIYRPKMQNGTFTTILPPGRYYNFSYQAGNNNEEFHNEEVYVSPEYAYQEIKREIFLKPVKYAPQLKTAEKDVFLNASVLDSPENKKPVANAKVIVEEVGGGQQYFNADENGRVDSIRLLPGRQYNVYTDINGERSKKTEVSTKGIEPGVLKNDVVYAQPDKTAETARNVLFSASVKNAATDRSLPGVSIVLKDDSGKITELITDENGRVENIPLEPNTTYEVFAQKNGIISPKQTFTTGKANKPFTFNKSFNLPYNEPSAASPLLNVVVKHPVTGQALSGVHLALTDSAGRTTELITDGSGQVKDVPLSARTEYTIIAYRDSLRSEPQTFSTGEGEQGVVFEKSLLLPLEETASENITLNAKVKHPVTGTPLSGVTLVAKDKKGKMIEMTTDENGEARNMKLSPNSSYEVYARHGNVTGPKQKITTGNGSESITINKDLTLAYNPDAEKNIALSMAVRHPSSRKGIADATVVITQANGEPQELTTDENGNITGFSLLPDTRYEIYAYKDQTKSEKQYFTTGSGDKPIQLKKSINLSYNAAATTSVMFSAEVHHPVTKKPIPGVTVYITDSLGKTTESQTNEKGLSKKVPLHPNSRYEVYAKKGNITSGKEMITTGKTGTSAALRKALLLAYEESPSENLVLNAKVKHPLTNKPLAGVNLVVTDASRKMTEYTTDSSGQVKNIHLLPNTRYEVYAYKTNIASNKQTIVTGPEDKPVTFDKSFLLSYSDNRKDLVGTPLDSSGMGLVIGSRFEHYYTYGVKVIDKTGDDYLNFIEYIVKLTKEQKKFDLYITGAASKVPMRKPGGNPQLARERADNFREMISRDLSARGVDVSAIEFKISSGVPGPSYRGDYIINRKIYEKYQYVKAAAR